MARTAATGFFARKNLDGGDETQVILRHRIANSTTLKAGDAVRVNTSGFLVGASAAGPVLGIVQAFVNDRGGNPFALGADAVGATLTPGDQIASSATNQTAATWMEAEVRVDPAANILWYNNASSAISQTNLYTLYSLTGFNQINGGSNSETVGNFQLVSLDPDGDASTTKGLFRICNPQLISQNGTAAVRSA